MSAASRQTPGVDAVSAARATEGWVIGGFPCDRLNSQFTAIGDELATGGEPTPFGMVPALLKRLRALACQRQQEARSQVLADVPAHQVANEEGHTRREERRDELPQAAESR